MSPTIRYESDDDTDESEDWVEFEVSLLFESFPLWTTYLSQNWWLFADTGQPTRPDGVDTTESVWPPFEGVRVELGGGKV